MGVVLVLGLAMAGVAALLAREIVLFRGGKHIITRPAFVLRVINSALLLLVLAMLLYGSVFLPGSSPERALLFWAVWLVLFTVFIALTINDLRLLRKVHRDRCEELLKRLTDQPEPNETDA